MSKRTRFSAEQKVRIVRELLENQIKVSQLSEQYGIHPNLIYKWKNELFDGALKTFSGEHSKRTNKDLVKIKQLETKLKERESIITEIDTENIQFKKNFTGKI